MKNKLRLEPSWLPFIAGAVQMILFAFAAHVYFGRWYIGAVSGLIPAFAIATGAAKINDIAKGRRWLAYGAGVVLLVLSPASVAPAIYLELSALPLPPAILIMTSVTWAMLADVGVVLSGAIAGKGMIAADAPALATTATHKPQTATQPAEPAPATAKSAGRKFAQPAKVRCTEPGCGMEYAAVGGKGGHYKKHHAPIAIDKSLLIGEK